MSGLLQDLRCASCAMPGFAAVVLITLRMSLSAGALGAAAGMVGDALDKGAEQ
jgi:hypothetical protein